MKKPQRSGAGLGWQVNIQILSQDRQVLGCLGIILTDASLSHDVPETDHCGDCRQCLDISRQMHFRTLSAGCALLYFYLTIEHKGVIAREFRRAVGNRIFRCDDCLAICPWNKFANQAGRKVGGQGWHSFTRPWTGCCCLTMLVFVSVLLELRCAALDMSDLYEMC